MKTNKTNQTVNAWSAKTRNLMKRQLNTARVGVYSGDLQSKISYVVHRRDNSPWRVRYRFPKQGIFVEKGVGRGYPQNRIANATSLVKNRRVPKPWYNPVLDKMVPELADKLGINLADESAANIKVRES